MEGNLELLGVSHYLCQFQAGKDIKGGIDFEVDRTDFVNEQTRNELLFAKDYRSLEEAISIFKGHFKTSYNIPNIYEFIIAKMLINGVKWEKRMGRMGTNKEEVPKTSEFELKLNKVSYDRFPPVLTKMKIDVLYFPSDVTFPAADMLYKTKDGKLVLIQVTTQQKPPKKDLKISALRGLFEKLGCKKEDIKTLVLCPEIALYEEFEFSFKVETNEDKEIQKYFEDKIEVWKVNL